MSCPTPGAGHGEVTPTDIPATAEAALRLAVLRDPERKRAEQKAPVALSIAARSAGRRPPREREVRGPARTWQAPTQRPAYGLLLRHGVGLMLRAAW